MPPWFIGLVVFVSFVAGATASIVGFGIGSLLTPIVAARFGIDLAIAAVVLPHLAGGLLRGWRLRRSIDWPVIGRFGVWSAVGGLVGAFVFARLAPAALTRTLGALLVLTATAGITGWSQRWKPGGPLIWILGGLSGFFGGVVGNQGGLRAAAMSTFGLAPAAFVATSTVIGILIDIARSPIYLYRAGERLAELWGLVVLAVAGVLLGTLVGERVMFGLSRARFRTVISVAIGFLGVWFLLGPA
jgi:uncharacterized protein